MRAPAAAQEDAQARTFPCRSCGAKLAFAPGTRSLKCEHCGAENEIAGQGDTAVAEHDFEAELAALEAKAETFEEEHVRCEGCGAEQTLPQDNFAGRCAFCGAPIVEKGYAKRLVRPQAILPFQVDRARAQESFRAWMRRRWLAPGDLKRYARSDSGLAGTYLPFWTFDCRTSSDYRGERGDDYYTTETYTTRNAQGESVTQTRQVRHTRWTPAAGHVEAFHDDVLVMGSAAVPGDTQGALGRWDLNGLVPYRPEFVSGFQAVAYRVDLRAAFIVARGEIDERVADLVRRDIGGDHQRIHDVATRCSDIAFKHILLPVWSSTYRYRDKAYRFTVNAQTGEVTGESPLSAWKVAFLVLAILAVVFLVAILSSKG
jgi:DNA-directed RNA polymerase subunit RPC12/RpoP